MTDLSESAKIRGLITSRHSAEENDNISTKLLLPSISNTESLIMLSPLSLLSTNIIPVNLVKGFIEGRTDRGKVT